jgi:CRP-like cAMP-binding protein
MPIPIRNSLLSHLSPEDLALLGPFERTRVKRGQTLEAANASNDFVYFIEDGLAWVVAEIRATATADIGIIGREGMTGLAFVYGDDQSPFRSVMRVEGSALRCHVTQLRKAITDSSTIRTVLLNYARAFSIQVGLTAVVNTRGTLEVRLARWLLMVSDRVGTSCHVTHEDLALMIGVRRSGVTLAVAVLESRGLLRARRGTLQILHREGLVEAAGDSYGLAEREYRRLRGQPIDRPNAPPRDSQEALPCE